jgi:hypothetical protein
MVLFSYVSFIVKLNATMQNVSVLNVVAPTNSSPHDTRSKKFYIISPGLIFCVF